MRNIEIIKHCLDAYNEAVAYGSKVSVEEYLHGSLLDEKLSLGVCYYVGKVLNIDVYTTYWIQRNLAPNRDMYWCTTSYNGIKYLKYRRDILEIEYKHHKKWGIFARFISPPSHEGLYNNLITE